MEHIEHIEQRPLNTLVALALAASLTFSFGGCANIQDDSTRTKTEGTLVGTGVGAGLGAIFGAIFGDGKGALIGAGIGAGIGALAGFFVGKHVADKKAEYASREDWLDDCIAHSRELNQETKTYNAKLSGDIKELEKSSKTLRAEYKKKKVTAEQMAQTRKAVDEMKAENTENIKKLQEDVAKQKTVLADARKHGDKKAARDLDKEIKTLNTQINQMKKYNSKLASVSSRLAV